MKGRCCSLLLIGLTLWIATGQVMCLRKVRSRGEKDALSTTRGISSTMLTLLHTTLLLLFLFIPQYETAGSVPKAHFDEQRSIYCFVERVIDGDTIRVRHVPGYPFLPWKRRQQPLQKRGIAEETLSIRIYGVDCPELSKRKNQASQPFAEQAKQFTTDFCLHSIVKITLIRKDHYGRALAAVERLPPAGPLLKCIPGLGRRDLSVALAEAGLAELYTSGGAEYWVRIYLYFFSASEEIIIWLNLFLYPSVFRFYQDNLEILERKIAHAKHKKRGIWSQGTNHITAAEHKRILRGDKAKEGAPLSTFAGALGDVTNSPKAAYGGARGGGGGVETKTSKSNSKENESTIRKKKNERRSTLLDVAVTGLEVVG